MTTTDLRRFALNLVCLRCHEVIDPGSPPDVEICGSCADDLRQDDDGLDAIRQYAELAATEAAMADHDARRAGGEPDGPILDSDFPW